MQSWYGKQDFQFGILLPELFPLLDVGCFRLCPGSRGDILHLFNLICSLPCRPVKEDSEPPEVDAPGQWHGVYVNRAPPTSSESATTVKSLIKSFDLGRPGIFVILFHKRNSNSDRGPMDQARRPPPPWSHVGVTTGPFPGHPRVDMVHDALWGSSETTERVSSPVLLSSTPVPASPPSFSASVSVKSRPLLMAFLPSRED